MHPYNIFLCVLFSLLYLSCILGATMMNLSSVHASLKEVKDIIKRKGVIREVINSQVF